MTAAELIEKAIKYQLLNELFTELLSDLKQDKININDSRELELSQLLTKLASDDLLITNENYAKEKRDFMVIDSGGDIILTISQTGELINNKTFECYLESSELEKLLKIYTQVQHSDTVFVLTADN